MADENGPKKQPEEITLQQAEAAFEESMILVGVAQEEFRAKLKDKEIPDSKDVRDTTKMLSDAWMAAQRERDRVAEIRRKRGDLVDGDIDFEIARTKVREQLDSIARAAGA